MNLILQAIKAMFRKNSNQMQEIDRKIDDVSNRVAENKTTIENASKEFDSTLHHIGDYSTSENVEVGSMAIGDTVEITLDNSDFPYDTIPESSTFTVSVGSGRTFTFVSIIGGISTTSNVLWFGINNNAFLVIAHLELNSRMLKIRRIM